MRDENNNSNHAENSTRNGMWLVVGKMVAVGFRRIGFHPKLPLSSFSHIVVILLVHHIV